MNVAVFGAAGWVGRAVLRKFAGIHQVRAVDLDPEAWERYRELDGEWEGDKVYLDIVDYHAVDAAMEGMDAAVHVAVYHGGAQPDEEDENPFMINVKGLWNVLESARRRGCRRVVHMGSCTVQHPAGVFFTSEVRRPDCGLYAVGKRLQEELCRQFFEGHGLSIVVLRPHHIIDSELGIERNFKPVEDNLYVVCRHDLAEACHRALESDIDFDVLHAASHPDAGKYCDMAHSRERLGMEFSRRIAPRE